jgi:S1-C subfamily serine protease
LRFIRARGLCVGFLVLATSFSLLLAIEPAAAQFPIRQVPRSWGPQMPVFPASGSSAPQGGGNAAQGLPFNSNAAPYGVLPVQPAQQTTATTPHPAIARIVVPERDGISYGSGTLIDARGQFGLVITNWHVVRDAAGPISVLFPDGFRSPAEVVKTDKDWDLAALSVHRPRAEPLPISANAPQQGETLAIAGYGGGDYRVASGQCTQYVAPEMGMPQEMVELSVGARQGDSGGPMLNERGEVAGVLFGSLGNTTTGSYGGRVLQFLATVVPGGMPGSDGLQGTSAGIAQQQSAMPSNALVGNSLRGDVVQGGNQWAPPAQQNLLDRVASNAITPPPQATALHEQTLPPDASSVYRRESSSSALGQGFAAAESSSLTPAQPRLDDGLLRVPELDGLGAHAAEAGDLEGEVNPKAAVESAHLAMNTLPATTDLSSLESAASSSRFGPLPPRVGVPTVATAGADIGQAPPDQLLAALWKRFGGTTLADQTKSVLAIVGFLSLLIVFLRINRHKEPEGDVD